MLVLTGTSDLIRVIMAEVHTTNEMDCYSTYRDITTSAFTPGRNGIATNGTSNVSLVGSPASSTQRVIDTLSVYNRDTITHTLTVKFYDGSNEFILWYGSLATTEKLEYLEGVGFRVITNNGSVKTTQGNNPTSSTLSTVVLGSDVVNNNASANTIADVTGLSFSVTSGHTYYFKAIIMYSSAATSTGSRWSINGPSSPTYLSYRSLYTVGATNHTINFQNTYDAPAAANTTSLTDGNIALIEGYITASANGTVIVRFASEVSSSAITAKAGSILQYQTVI